MESLKTNKSFLIVGCGGLGCNIIESLMRFGAGDITVCDGDCFDESNLSRQLYATPKTLGMPKVSAAADRAAELIYPGCLIAINEFFTKENARSLLDGIDIVIDALDNIESRLLLEDECAGLGIPIIHGAVNGWLYQVAVALPGAGLLRKIYGARDASEAAADSPSGQDTDSGRKANPRSQSSQQNLSFTVQLCAARQAAEAVKLALGIKSPLENALLLCDIESCEEQLLRFDFE